MNDDEAINQIELKNNHRLYIYHDQITESPRDWCNLGTMICWHSGYHLGDKQIGHNHFALMDMADSLNINSVLDDLQLYDDIYGDEEKLQEWLNIKKEWVCIPLYLYDHSGITMNTKGFGCSWDSGQVGYIYCPTDKILKEYGNTSESTLEKVIAILEDEVKTYDQYLRCEVYGFKLVKVKVCNLGHEHEEEINSCWGFYGDDWKTNGIIDHIDSELIPEEELAV